MLMYFGEHNSTNLEQVNCENTNICVKTTTPSEPSGKINPNNKDILTCLFTFARKLPLEWQLSKHPSYSKHNRDWSVGENRDNFYSESLLKIKRKE